MCKSKLRASILSVCGAFVILIFLYVSNPPDNFSAWLVGTLSDTLQISLVFTPAILMALCFILEHLIRWLRPSPGNRPLSDDSTNKLRTAFGRDRDALADGMIPNHKAKATPARSSKHVDLGDARHVLSNDQAKHLREFLGAPRKRLRTQQNGEKPLSPDVLIITGEPGAGKSVLMQEVHTSLSRGVEKGNHAFIPVLVFARDIRLEDLLKVEQDQTPIKAFLESYYKSRIGERVTEGSLVPMYELVRSKWRELDFLVIIDGLDEIPQRSTYEEVQRKLVAIIKRDLRDPGQGVTHRYILSCRVDEDIDVFAGAQKLELHGLTERQKEHLCRALVESSSDENIQDAIQRALNSPQLVASHVFRRNPYFLALLTSYHTQEKRPGKGLNFDSFMMDYLEREATRSYALARDGTDTPFSLKRFEDLEKAARPFLQAVAFWSTMTPQEGALYSEVPLGALIKTCLDILCSPPQPASTAAAQNSGMWGTIYRFLKSCVSENFRAKTQEEKQYLDEESRDRLPIVSKKLQSEDLSQKIAIEVLEDIAEEARLEKPGWYSELAANYTSMLQELKLDRFQVLAGLFLLRSMAAAHVLRVIYLRQEDGKILLRFRHRRLAEYYAACYFRDRWDSVQKELKPLPWISPVLNLVCAIEPEYRALTWLVDRVSDEPTEPLYEWRYSVEISCEAASFAPSDSRHTGLLRRLITKLLHPLLRGSPESHSTTPESGDDSPGPVKGFAVTRVVLHRKLYQLAQLATSTRVRIPLEEKTVHSFYQSASQQEPEWLAAYQASSAAIEQLSGKAQPLRERIRVLWKFVQHPPSLLFSPEKDNKSLRSLRPVVIGTTVLGELMSWLSGFGLLFGLTRLLELLGVANDFSRELFQILAASFAIVLILVRSLNWMRTPSKAALQSSLPWRLFSSVFVENFETILFIAMLTVLGGVFTLLVYLAVAGKGWVGQAIQVMFVCLGLWVLEYFLILVFDWVSGTIREAIQERGFLSLVVSSIKALMKYLILPAFVIVLLIVSVRLLLPSPSPTRKIEATEPAISEETVNKIVAAVESPIPGPPSSDLGGKMESLLLERELSRRISQASEYSETIDKTLKERKSVDIMLESPRTLSDGQQISSAQELNSVLEQERAHLEEERNQLRQQNNSTILWLISFLLGILICSLILTFVLQAVQDRKQSAKIREAKTIKEFCAMIEGNMGSERVQRTIISRIDAIMRFSSDDLRQIEVTAEELLKASDVTRRQLGTEVAALADRMSTRLRYHLATGVTTTNN